MSEFDNYVWEMSLGYNNATAAFVREVERYRQWVIEDECDDD